MKIERPLDFLGSRKGKQIIILSQVAERQWTGKLITFDIHLNLVIQNGDNNYIFISGENILAIY